MTMQNEVVKNWIALAEYDLKTAQAMLESKRYLYVLFMSQQCIEKILKAIYVSSFGKSPPYTHNIVKLIAELELTDELTESQQDILTEINSYYIETRYTEDILKLSKSITHKKAEKLLKDVKDIYRWLKRKIQSKNK